jgi:regulator of RNase E activity RraA
MSLSFTFGELPPPPPPQIIEELRSYEVAWISDSMEMGLMAPEIGAIYPNVRRTVGPALTVAIPPGDFLMVTAALKLTRPGDVMVIDGRGDTGRAVWGDYFTAWAKGMGLEGVVIDGATRDVGGIEKLGFPVFARGTTPRKPVMNGYGEINVPVSCGGVCVLPGDIVVADREGVVVIPTRHLDEVLQRLRATAEKERSLRGAPPTGRADYEAYAQQFAARLAPGRLGAK